MEELTVEKDLDQVSLFHITCLIFLEMGSLAADTVLWLLNAFSLQHRWSVQKAIISKCMWKIR